MSLPADYFDALYAANDDPWHFRSRWYESRKRQLTLASLPRQRYQRVFEPGCANGELSAGLAQRCEHLLCCDASQRAVALARERLTDYAHAQVYAGQLPQCWPEQRFDLIVISEVGYYLDQQALDDLLQHCIASLSRSGHLLACHWRHPIEGSPLDGEQVHQLLRQTLPFEQIVFHQEKDFVLELWSASPFAMNLHEVTL
ncbi:class I SAM-dependent DNA methyltransferase [Pseudomonas sp. EA_35y_Pfl2_R111]|uniref:class I SAM-dependent DNA methyltransferase n=1 Tax=Pseudomonas sp. EA_35y_Pfl2_R111 TaxID=3088689 RepID=UPI0030D9069C